MIKYLIVPLLVLFSLANTAKAQQIPIYRHFYLNPSILNPAFNGIDGYNRINLFYRQQWLGVEDAPEVVGLNFQYPTKNKLFFGFDVYSEKTILLRSSSALISVGYALPLSKDQEIRFALSGGGALNNLDLTQEELNTPDPVIFQANTNSYALDARFGLAYKFKNLNLGFSLPQLLRTESLTDQNIEDVDFSQFNDKIIYGSYEFNLSPYFLAKPVVTYTQITGIEEVSGALGISYKNLVTLGATYQNTLGGFFGVNINNIQIQYNYEVSSLPGSALDNSSHGIQLSFKLGSNKRKKDDVVKGANLASEDTQVPTEEPDHQDVVEKGSKELIVIEKDITKDTANDGSLKGVDLKEQPPKNEPPKENLLKEKELILEENGSEKILTQQDTPPLDKETAEKTEEITNELPATEKQKLEYGLMNRKGGLTMNKGYYVVTGVFRIIDNAIKHSRTMMNAGYNSDMVINPKNNYYYIFVHYEKSEKAKAEDVIKELRKKKMFKDAWLMEIQ